ncbi:MAG: DUF4440 domain-containing protein [Acidobacteriota bacterium]
MKRCPTCKRTFNDDTLSFCLEDGTPLVTEAASRADSQETLVSPRVPAMPPQSGVAPTQAYSQLPGSPPPYRPAAQPHGPDGSQRKAWPWVVAGLAVLLIVAAVIVAAFTVPGLLRAEKGKVPQPMPSRPSPTPEPSASPASDVPTDSAEVLAQLTKLEKDWTEANTKGDKEALEKILADEYIGNEDDSRTKRKYIDTIKPDTAVENWEISDVTVNQTGDRAVVNGRLKQETSDETYVYDFVDTFVWRDHRWQAVTSHATRVK